ncbi:hypothetical protein ES705_33722 [subsurface metagenome]
MQNDKTMSVNAVTRCFFGKAFFSKERFAMNFPATKARGKSKWSRSQGAFSYIQE